MRYLIVDCETAPIKDVETYLEPVSAPQNYKDPEKIKAYEAEERKRQAEKAALDIDLARLVAIGYHDIDSGQSDVLLMRDEFEERNLLGKFWDFWGGLGTCAVTFNGLAYDIPLLLRRSLYLGVRAPKLQLERFKHPEVIDLMQILSLDGRLKLHSLRFYANRFGIPVNDELTGADIAEAVRNEDWLAVDKHCAADVATTLALAKRIGAVPVKDREMVA